MRGRRALSSDKGRFLKKGGIKRVACLFEVIPKGEKNDSKARTNVARWTDMSVGDNRSAGSEV